MTNVPPRDGFEPIHLYVIPQPSVGRCDHVVARVMGWPIYCQMPRGSHPFPPPKLHIPLEPKDGP